jgi:hypothetical protein
MPRYTTYSTGTVTATNGSRTVTGVNTAWMVASTQEFQVVGGDLLRIGNQRPVVIDTVDSPTQVTLVENWPHSTASASAYTIIRYATPPEARVLGALESLAQRGTAASPFERITFDSGGVRFQMRDDGSGLVGLYIGATGTADGSLTLAETINRTTLARILRGPLSWTGTTYMGLLIQSLTTAQRDALSSPGNGGIVYNSTLDRHQFRAGGAWHEHVRRGGDTFTGTLVISPASGWAGQIMNAPASGDRTFKHHNFANELRWEELATRDLWAIARHASGSFIDFPFAIANGLIGIGTNAPWQRLSVIGNGTPGDMTTARQFSVGLGATYGVNLGYTQSGVAAPFAGVLQAIDAGNGTFLLLNPTGGNVGIGTTSPAHRLEVATAATNSTDGINVTGGASRSVTLRPAMEAGAYSGIVQAGDSGFIFTAGALNTGAFVIAPWADGTPGLRMLASGLVGIGTTSPGAPLTVASGSAQFPKGITILEPTHATSRRTLLEIGNWSIGQDNAGSGTRDLFIFDGTAGAVRYSINTTGHLLPGADNALNLGSGSSRMATIFAGTGTINTSDAREKDNIAPITDALLDRWAGVEAISFKFKGRNRTHFGYTAQQVLECMGEDAWTYALLCRDQITKPVKRTVKKMIQKTEAKTVNEETIEIIDGVPTIVVKTREVQEPVVEMVQVIGADGEPVMVERQIEVDGEPDKDGNPTKTTQTITEPRLHPVPVMVETEVKETVDEPAGDRLGLRYDQCAVIEAAWARRELSRALTRIAALEAA